MVDDVPPWFESMRQPRVSGSREHLDRARMFAHFAKQDGMEELIRWRMRLAAVYSARAMVEIMLDAAMTGEVAVGRKALDTRLLGLLPRYSLVERIRVHDFHRTAVVDLPIFRMQGPIKLRAREANSGVQVQLTQDGPVTTTTGDAEVAWNRALQTDHGRFLDDDTKEWLTLEQIVDQFLSGADAAIAAFEALVAQVPMVAAEQSGE